MLKKKVIVIISIVLILLMSIVTVVSARYIINKKQSIKIITPDSNVNVTINTTESSIDSPTSNTTFTVNISNNNTYPVIYSVTSSSDKFVITGGVTNAEIAANTAIDVVITVAPKTGVLYTAVSDAAKIVVDITKPYKLATTNFDLKINTFNYNLKDIQMAQNTVKTGANFTENITTTDKSGMYSMADESGTSYYYRGVIENNYVSFANKIWRIMRINGDGSYRLVLDSSAGTTTYSTSNSTTVHNLGYMHGTSTNATSNSTDSAVKTFLDNWYKNNLQTYDSYIDKDAIFWNDRTAIGTDNYGYTYYGGWNRIVNNSPSIKPTVKADMFSVTTTKGNGKLTYPIGLVTADEIVLAGGTMSGATAKYLLGVIVHIPYGLDSSKFK